MTQSPARCVRLGGLGLALTLGVALAQPAVQRQTVRAGSANVAVTSVRFPAGRYDLSVALAGPRVASNAPLAQIAARSGATCAINGTFLAAYAGQSGEPYGTLVVGGRVLHLGTVGTRLDVLQDGRVRFARDGLRIRGTLDGSGASPNNWYAYNVNQTPSNANYAYLYTPDYGPRLRFVPDVAVIVRNGVVERAVRGEAAQIPADGFVLALAGSEVRQLAGRFTPGRRADYRVEEADGTPLGARFSLGAGPLLVRDGSVVADPSAEGFRQDKILTARGARSAVGFTAAGDLLLVTFPGATIREEAQAMRALGAVNAMNLDGGASSGLVCGGRAVVPGGRQIANALVVRSRR
ncbi:phosphodiester glycosidase family protein [Deinococcus apachensis]|uniref:phosphodiester glycosidase family protein n=1 Tax=Deinococcus apachensis TaxID=309886 RepID=UPI0003798808|nr:phosphodiester glycosidase family protein [Deinococcus apachensis]